ncbi:MAG: hypothetical protein QG657_1598 [Acidobacteriota bacterium]|nr:hypothetical protein [Acidobacteriota bacterium]
MKIIFKHSYNCPISRRAKIEMDRFLRNQNPELEYEFVDVNENRSRSNEVAERYRIQHESPQVIILGDADDVLWQASHYDITEENLTQALSDIS